MTTIKRPEQYIQEYNSTYKPKKPNTITGYLALLIMYGFLLGFLALLLGLSTALWKYVLS